MALAHHDAAHGDEGGRADAEFLGPQHGGHHHVAAGLDAAIGAQANAMAIDSVVATRFMGSPPFCSFL